MNLHPGYFVAIFGGAVAGAEAAYQLTRRSIYCVVFEQNATPYGKIEDGLPKWHIKLRDKEEKKIDEKLTQSHGFFIPCTALGRDVYFEDVVKNWGFSAVLLATGAWRDRPLPVEGIDEYIGRGFYYQNPFVEWFNHYHEPEYKGQQCEIYDGAVVVGGGLASIDVVKILMLETVHRALEARGLKTDIFTLEREGIPRVLEKFGLTLSDLGVKGCTLYYRRRVKDMPLAQMPPRASEQQQEKVFKVREKILKNAQTRYLFHFQELSRPIGKIVKKDRLVGLVFQKTKVEAGRVIGIPGSEFEVRGPLIISSIGSIPKPIEGIPMEGELYSVRNPDTGQLQDYEHVFALGNAVTGKGNIRESELHARKVATYVIEKFFRWQESDYRMMIQNGPAENWTPGQNINRKYWRTVEQIQKIIDRIRELQHHVGYDGDYHRWIAAHKPVRLETLIRAH